MEDIIEYENKKRFTSLHIFKYDIKNPMVELEY